METLLWYFFYAVTPALIIFLAKRIPAVSKLGTIVVAYGLGLLVGNLGLFPDNIASIHDLLTTVTVPLALPLLFFSLDLSQWRSLARRSILSFLAAMISVTLVSVVLYLLMPHLLGDEAWKAGGMLVGVYTGGTPNLAAVGRALDVSPLTLVAVQGADVIVGAVLLLFLVAVAPRLYPRLLPTFAQAERRDRARAGDAPAGATDDADNAAGFSPYFTGWSRSEVLEMAGAFGLAAVIVGVGAVFMLFLPEASALPATMLTITTLGVAASFVRPVRDLRNSFQLGYYLILIFSLTVSSMANVGELATAAPGTVLYVAILLVAVSVVHVALSALFRVDSDTHIITATSFIYSPPFVPVVAAALGNRKVVVPGIVLGVAGWIAGNYLGLVIAYALRGLG